jgi:hypothetical protein
MTRRLGAPSIWHHCSSLVCALVVGITALIVYLPNRRAAWPLPTTFLSHPHSVPHPPARGLRVPAAQIFEKEQERASLWVCWEPQRTLSETISRQLACSLT